MSSAILDLYDLIVGQLQDAGLPVVDDPRAVRPPLIVVEPPTVTGTPNGHHVSCTVPIIVVAPPPGNRDAARFLMGLTDQVVDILEGPSTAEPGTYTISGQEMPCYTVSLTLIATRS